MGFVACEDKFAERRNRGEGNGMAEWEDSTATQSRETPCYVSISASIFLGVEKDRTNWYCTWVGDLLLDL